MTIHDILAVVAGETDNTHVLEFAEQLVEQKHGSLSALVLAWIPTVAYASEVWSADPWWSDLYADTKNRLDEAAESIRARVNRTELSGPTQQALIEVGAARNVVGMHARHADLSIISSPAGSSNSSAHAILEGALFGSGRPVILVPQRWKRAQIAKNVMVCWKPTREAARALADAEPLLELAETITVVTVDAEPSSDGFGPLPGFDIAAHLARKRFKTDLINLDSAGHTEAAAILEYATDLGADLIVMGGFGRSRLSELVFGGVTREMLAKARTPILMSH